MPPCSDGNRCSVKVIPRVHNSLTKLLIVLGGIVQQTIGQCLLSLSIANVNEQFCDNGGLDLVVELVRIEGVVDNVRQAALYCISIAIESNGKCACVHMCVHLC